MKESCYCGRTGEVEDRDPILDGRGKRVLQCPECGHGDDLCWLSEEAGRLLWEEAMSRRGVTADESLPAA
ncbi:hypothetical protein [Rubrobacter aplysinae]|uniref:hypothetical protein n=1 Tax=Rubrobacter aplysinae TaxID=909625 RepID=UPI00064C1BAB|nr:hypothetical protein [Rubrobacter aplysinae]